jgi:hypothetical protein
MYTAVLLKLAIVAVIAAIAALLVRNLFTYIVTMLSTLPQF